MKTLFKPLIAVPLLFFAASANAQLMLQISDTADFTGTVVGGTDTDGDGLLTVSSNISDGLGSWIASVNTGISSLNSPYSDGLVDTLHLNSVNVSGGVGTIYVRLSESGYVKTEAPYITSFGGITQGSVEFKSYVDPSNSDFTTAPSAILLSDSGVVTGGNGGEFSGSDSGYLNITGPYSMSIYASVTHDKFSTSSFDYEIKVPEPTSIALLGLGLLGFAATRRKKALV